MADRRHTRDVELAAELVAECLQDCDIDRRQDAMRSRGDRFLEALGRWLRSVIEVVPGGARAWALFVGVVDARRGEAALEALDDTARQRRLTLARAIAGMRDGVQP
jgi:hypothetical protein